MAEDQIGQIVQQYFPPGAAAAVIAAQGIVSGCAGNSLPD